MLVLLRDDVKPSTIVSLPGSTSTHSASPDMHFRHHLIQRWIGDDAPPKRNASPRVVASADRDQDEVQARQTHDHLAALDWEREEFERELALRFVVHDLSLGLQDQQPASSAAASPRPSNEDTSTHTLTPWPRSSGSTSTLQPETPASSSAIPSPPFPSPSLSLSSPPARPMSFLASMLRAPHRSSPSVLSLPTSHISSGTSSSGAPSLIAPSLFSHIGRKRVPITSGVVEIPQATRPRRHVSVPTPLAPKKRRLIVRGISVDDDRAVDGVKRWANGLGAVSRVSRTPDGTLWIEFQDKRVAENVCCLQAQVLIPEVGRVVLDWAEGRHPG